MLNQLCQNNISLSMDHLLIGTGWHGVEEYQNRYFRWSGPDTTSTIHLPLNRDQESRMNLMFYGAASEEIISGLKLSADGTHLTTTLGKERNPAFVTTILPANPYIQPGDETILELTVPVTLPASQTNPADTTYRKVGIALQHIEIFPLSRPLFTAEKYNDPDPFDGVNYIKHNPGVKDAVLLGRYDSAYDYFLKNGRINAADGFTLHRHFDECPGDLYDILQADMQKRCKALENNYMEEIKRLREVVVRQGDTIRVLKKQVQSQGKVNEA